MQRLAGKGKVRFAERLVLRGMRVNQTRDISGERIPIGDQLGLADKLADAGTDQAAA